MRWKQSVLSDYRNSSFWSAPWESHISAGHRPVGWSTPEWTWNITILCNALVVLPSAGLHLNFFWSCWIVKHAYIPSNGNCLHHRQCGIIKSSTLVWNFGHCVIFPGWLCKNEIFDPIIIILEYLKYLRYLKYLLVHLIILVLKSRQGTDSHADNGDRHKRGRDHWHTMSGHADEGEHIPAAKYFFSVSSNRYLADLPFRTTVI